jgi:chromosome partitioning protein
MVISIYNSKGGVGKTITAVNLAAVLSRSRRVLLIDMDAQYSATSFFSLSSGESLPSIYDVLLGEVPLQDAAVAIEALPGLYVVPGDVRMEAAARQLPDLPAADQRLKRALRHLPADFFDVCLLDCPSRFDYVARNALMAASHVLVPINSERMALDCATDSTRRTAQLREAYDMDVPALHILLTAYRAVYSNARLIESAAQAEWPGQVCRTSIRHTERVKELSSRHKTVVDLQAGTLRDDYTRLAQEVLEWAQP